MEVTGGALELIKGRLSFRLAFFQMGVRFALDTFADNLVVSRTTTARSRPGTAVGFSHGQ